MERTYGVDDEQVLGEDLKHGRDTVLDLLLTRDTRRVDVVDTGANLVRVAVLLEGLEQLHVALRRLDGDDVRVESLDRREDIVEVGVAEVRVRLEAVGDASGGELERWERPLEVRIPVGLAERETLTERGLVDLHSLDASLLEIDDLVAERERELHALELAGDVGTGERPVKDGDGTREHALHRLRSEALRVAAPLDGDGARTADVRDDDRGTNVAGAVGLHPAVLGEDEALELLAEVLHHVVTLGLAVHKQVEADALLEADDVLDLLLDELLVLRLGDLLLVELRTGGTNLGGLREGSDGRGRELRQSEVLVLELPTDSKGALALQHVGGDGCNPLSDGVVRGALEFTTLSNGGLVRCKSSRDLGILGARQSRGENSDLLSLLESECEPVLLLGGELVLGCKGNGCVEQRRRGRNDHAVTAEDRDRLLTESEAGLEIGLPDVTARHDTEGKNLRSRLQRSDDFVELLRCTVKVNMQTGNGELRNEGEVRGETTVVRGYHDLRRDGDELSVSLRILLLEVRSLVENEDGLIDLDGLNTSSLKIAEELLVDRKQLREERDRLEASLRLLGSLTEGEERDGTENNRAGDDTKGLRLVVLLERLVEKELEVGLIRELGDDEVVVRVEPRKEMISPKSKGSLNRIATVRRGLHMAYKDRENGYVPLLHFASWDIDTIGLTTTAHGEVDIKRRKVVTSVALRDGVESRRVVENMVVEREVTAVCASM